MEAEAKGDLLHPPPIRPGVGERWQHLLHQCHAPFAVAERSLLFQVNRCRQDHMGEAAGLRGRVGILYNEQLRFSQRAADLIQIRHCGGGVWGTYSKRAELAPLQGPANMQGTSTPPPW